MKRCPLLHPAVGRIDLTVEVIFGDGREQKLFLMTARGAHGAKLRALSFASNVDSPGSGS